MISWVSLFSQIIIWFVIPAVSNSSANHTNNTLSMIVLIQYIPRVFLIISLNSKIVKASGVVTRTAWAGAAYNLLLYTLASHVCRLFPTFHFDHKGSRLAFCLVKFNMTMVCMYAGPWGSVVPVVH